MVRCARYNDRKRKETGSKKVESNIANRGRFANTNKDLYKHKK